MLYFDAIFEKELMLKRYGYAAPDQAMFDWCVRHLSGSFQYYHDGRGSRFSHCCKALLTHLKISPAEHVCNYSIQPFSVFAIGRLQFFLRVIGFVAELFLEDASLALHLTGWTLCLPRVGCLLLQWVILLWILFSLSDVWGEQQDNCSILPSGHAKDILS